MSDNMYYSQSSVTSDWNCPRAHYWGHHFAGVGLSSESKGLELFLGTAVHDGLAAIAQGVGIDQIAEAAVKQVKEGLLAETEGEAEAAEFASEQGALVEGLLRGFYKQVWPQLMAQFTVHSIEQPCVYRTDDTGMENPQGRFIFMARHDIILQDAEGNLWYWEYKSTSSSREQWINSWSTAVQVHSGIRAFEQTSGEVITGVVVQGLYKGYQQKGKQSSILCYAYHKPGEPPFTTAKWSYEYKPGFRKFPVWHREGGVKRWVDEMPAEILAEQFPQTPPIFINEGLVNGFFRQQASRQLEIHMAAEGLKREDLDVGTKISLLDMAFPQRFDRCNSSWGHPCEFRQLCHGAVGNPLDLGFVLRDTSHREPFIRLVEVSA